MVKIDCIGMDLYDETKNASTKNKILSFHLFGQCSKCKRETELIESFYEVGFVEENL